MDISRGDLIVSAEAPATVAKSVKAALVWMDQRPLELNRRYLLKHTSQTVPVFVTAIEHRTDIGTLAHEPADTLEMNGIGVVTHHSAAADRAGSLRRESRHRRIHPDRSGDQRHGCRGHDYGDLGASALLTRIYLEPGDGQGESGALGTSRRRSGVERAG